jgi:hypothetical protein
MNSSVIMWAAIGAAVGFTANKLWPGEGSSPLYIISGAVTFGSVSYLAGRVGEAKEPDQPRNQPMPAAAAASAMGPGRDLTPSEIAAELAFMDGEESA